MNQEHKFKILVVDDDNLNRKILYDILQGQYVVYVASAGKEAIENSAELRPDLILLDIIMPDMDGFEVLLKLKDDAITRDIPVICITGLNDVANEERGFFLGAVDYITKPFHNSIVKARVRTHLKIVNQIRTIERLGMIDPLTNIPNRRHFERQIKAEWQRALRDRSPISVLSIDVDNFKNYNDMYGHPQGDVLLTSLAKILTASVLRGGDLSARVGGEEFQVVLPDTKLEDALAIGRKICEKVAETAIPSISGNITTRVTVSMGVASAIPTQDNSYFSLLIESDKALYAAKTSGKNKVCTISP